MNAAASVSLRERLEGSLLGTAVGDALGLAAENLSPEKIRRRWKGEWRMRLVFGKGMISDDTEHTLMVAQSLLANDESAAAFQRALGWKLRWWFMGLPGGVGLATARACIKLWLGFSPERSGVMSAGSGPAMRSAIIGAYFSEDAELRREFVRASTRLTHRSWQSEVAALAVAEAAALAPRGSCEATEVWEVFSALSAEAEWQKIVLTMKGSLAAGEPVVEFARRLNQERGVSGYALHVVPVAVYSWLRHRGDYRATLVSALDCGGDTDTVGAIAGGLAGGDMGKAGIPAEWMGDLWEWPRSVGHMEKVAERLEARNGGDKRAEPVNWFWPGLLVRNLFFLVVVVIHGLRRLAPPY